jgi:hypothetical protein
MNDFLRSAPSRMELVAWALAGMVPVAAADGFDLPLLGLIGFAAPSLALGIVAWRNGNEYWLHLLLGLPVLHWGLLIALARICYLDPRYLHPLTDHYLPVFSVQATHGVGFFTDELGAPLLSSTTWAIAMAIAITVTMKRRPIESVRILGSSCGLFAFVLLLHLLTTPYGARWRSVAWVFSDFRVIAGFWTLILLYPAFFLALFHDCISTSHVKALRHIPPV